MALMKQPAKPAPRTNGTKQKIRRLTHPDDGSRSQDPEDPNSPFEQEEETEDMGSEVEEDKTNQTSWGVGVSENWRDDLPASPVSSPSVIDLSADEEKTGWSKDIWSGDFPPAEVKTEIKSEMRAPLRQPTVVAWNPRG
jgi:hypothetical protein